jgi:hypothetical protein
VAGRMEKRSSTTHHVVREFRKGCIVIVSHAHGAL